MPAPKGNQFAKGNKGGGRKGYEYEFKQLERMKKLLNGSLTLAEKIQKGKATQKQIEAYERLMKITLKIMDKLHANRQHIEEEFTGELPIRVIKIGKMDVEKAKKRIEAKRKNDLKSGE